MSATNIISLPTSDDQLAKTIIKAWDRCQHGRAEWIEGTLELGAALLEGRDRMGNIEFGVWLERHELNFLNKNDRASLIEMARAPDVLRLVLEETKRTSYQYIRNEEFRLPYVRNTETIENTSTVPVSEPLESSETVAETKTETTIEADTNPPVLVERIELRVDDEPDDDEPAEKKSRKGKQKSKSENKQEKKQSVANLPAKGEAGLFLDAWIRQAVPQKRRAPIFAILWLGNMSQAVLNEIAQFIRETPDLPLPWCGSRNPTPALFWREMPQQIIDKIERSVPKGDYPAVLLATVRAWAKIIGPALAAWRAAGRPVDSRAWYVRYTGTRAPLPVVAAAPVCPPSPELLASLSPEMAALLDDNRPYDNFHEGFQPSGEGPIQAYGAQIWPRPPGARWSFRDAFYAFHIWNEMQALMGETRPAERARALMNPLQPILANLHGGAAAALRSILEAQSQSPEKIDDTAAPAKRLNFE